MSSLLPTRREAIRAAAAAGAAVTLSRLPGLSAAPGTSPSGGSRPSTMVGIAMSVAPLAQPNHDRLLDDLHERAGVNALFPFIYTHIPRRAGAPAAGFHGGNYATPHMQYYRDTDLTFDDMRAPEFGGVDVLARTIPAARRKGIKTFAWIIEDNQIPELPHWDSLYEVDFHGRRMRRHPSGPCNNNPRYRGFLLGLVEDYVRSYELDGIMWGSERQGGLLNALGAYHNGSRADPSQATCFCEFCQQKGRADGIDVERARRGFGALEQFVREGRAGRRPRDGYFVAFWRLLLNYPELLAWENLWIRSRHELQAEIYRKVKSINPVLPVGWHLWHNLSFSPFHRAEEDFAALTGFSDFLRPVLYSNCAGERMRSFVDSTHGNVFGDVPADQTEELLYRLLDYKEAPYAQVTAIGFSADYVLRETRRAVEGVAGTPTQIWPGIDIDVPVPVGASHCTPESVRQTVKAVFAAGASGVLLSRNYVEMKPENLSAAGAALKELGVI